MLMEKLIVLSERAQLKELVAGARRCFAAICGIGRPGNAN